MGDELALAGGFWPDAGLPERSRAAGWRPTPFREFVLKVHQLCNLACDYCYMYTHADQSWRTRPIAMGAEVVQALARRIGAHVRRHGQETIRVVLHGGEPLLLGWRRLVEIGDAVRAELPGGCSVRVVIQTNGVALDEECLAAFVNHDIHVGVSVDGDGPDHDRHRLFRSGRGSAADVFRALDRLSSPPHRAVFAGLLCTIDLRTDPVECYERLLTWRPPVIDFLLPHANWSNPPSRPVGRRVPSYADWLIAVFDRWYGAPHQETNVRLLSEILHLALGGASRSEQVGLSPVAVAVIDTDGDIALLDSLKTTYAGAPDTGYNVLTDDFDACLDHPGVVARQIGVQALARECRSCKVHRICGAGNYAHRYSADSGFRHPTVYCDDMMALVRHVQARVRADIRVPI